MDASKYEDYVLVLLVVKYVLDAYAENANASVVAPNRRSFADIVALKGNKEIGEKINNGTRP
jgi:type I restriction enzyme M protein